MKLTEYLEKLIVEDAKLNIETKDAPNPDMLDLYLKTGTGAATTTVRIKKEGNIAKTEGKTMYLTAAGAAAFANAIPGNLVPGPIKEQLIRELPNTPIVNGVVEFNVIDGKLSFTTEIMKFK